MNATQNKFRLAVLPAALMVAFGPALADDEIEQLIKPDSSVSIGFGGWSDDRHQQGIYDGMRESGAHGLVDADIVTRDDATGTWMTLNARNLGLDTRELRAEYLRQGNIGLSVEYSRIPRDNPYTFTTRLRGIGETTQIVSTSANPGPLQTVKLGAHRDLTTLGFYKSLGQNLDFKFTFKNEDKTGERQWGRGSAAEFAVEPIDSTTRQLETVLNYTTKKFQLSGGYIGSWYDTKHEMVSVFPEFNTTVIAAGGGNPAVVFAGPTYLTLPLDNQAHKLFMNGGYSFTPTTRATLKMSYTRATQNERLPTQGIFSSNGNGLPLSLVGSPTRLDGEINTTMIQLGLTSRPTKDLSFVGSIRYHNVEDETPAVRFVEPLLNPSRVPAGCASGTCVDNTPFSYKTLTSKLEGTYNLAEGYNLTAGIEERRQDRHVPTSTSAAGGLDPQRVVPMRNEVDETTWRLELRRTLSDVLNGSVAYIQSRRTGSNYIAVAPTAPGNTTTANTRGFLDISNLINPINVADRDRAKVRLGLDWTPLESLSFQFNVEDGRDNYDLDGNRPFGMDKGTARFYSLDVAYTLNDEWQLNAWYSHDRNQAKQLGARANNAGGNEAIKRITLEDIGDSLGFGVRGEMTSRVKLGADLEWTRTVSKNGQDINLLAGTTVLPNTLSGNLPDIENRLLRLSVFSTYALNKQSDVRLNVIHERWRTDDWSLNYANGAPFAYSDGTTVTAKAKQTANFVGVRYIYSFQ